MLAQDFSGRQNSLFSYLILLGDLVVVNLIFSYLSRFYPELFMDGSPILQTLVAVTLTYLVAAGNRSVILHHRTVRSYKIITNVSRNCFLFGLYYLVINYLGWEKSLLSWKYLGLILAIFVGLSIYRISARKLLQMWRRREKNLRQVVIVGDSSNSIQLYKEITSDRSTGFKVLGYFADQVSPNYPFDAIYLGTPSEAIGWMEKHPEVKQLYCSLPSARKDEIVPIINYCENHLVHFFSLPNLYNYLHHRVFFNTLGSVPYLSLRKDPLMQSENQIIKRIFDILVSGLFLCTFFPFILLIVTIITKITMPGPVFFRQKRNGLNDKEFYCFKFRSMKVNKDADKVQATKNDPRKTNWGNIMRKTSIDELPQFINVFLGDMSIVGPRPHMVKHTEEYSQLIDKYMVRHFVKPGITGWAQVTGFRGETKELKDMEGRIKGDIWYIEHWNLWLDIYIMYKTVANAVHGEKNAY